MPICKDLLDVMLFIVGGWYIPGSDTRYYFHNLHTFNILQNGNGYKRPVAMDYNLMVKQGRTYIRIEDICYPIKIVRNVPDILTIKVSEDDIIRMYRIWKPPAAFTETDPVKSYSYTRLEDKDQESARPQWYHRLYRASSTEDNKMV